MKRLFFTMAISLSGIAMAEEKMCTYKTYEWNSAEGRPANFQLVVKPYLSLMESEIDPATNCTVCEEDQQLIEIANVPSFYVCKYFAEDIRQALEQAITQGQIIEEIVGYRVGKTKGEVDESGNRTQFSNHSFGIAIDINQSNNGLYDNCIEYGVSCRLIKGGRWSPDNDRSIMSDSPIVLQMKAVGFKWGGQIAGNQKDFMHFSVTGY